MEQEQIPVVKKSFYTLVIKRVLDFLISAIAIIILSPVILIISFLELFIHGRPIFYVQERPGYKEKSFKIIKFRSMNNKKDENGKLLPGNERITSFGRFLRRTSIDELPELFCILTGKMSIIGPRPLLPMSLPFYTERHRKRHEIRPGLACVPLKPISSWTWNDQFENDIWYIENCSFLIDVKMLIAILREAINGSDYRVNDTRPEYDGTNLFYDSKGIKDISNKV